jgi:ribonuclease G
VARQIIINSTPQEARVATMENARLIEIQVERVRERGIAGSICKGRVLRVLPGMQAAFVDIGLAKAAFLPGADFFPMSADEYALAEDTHEEEPAGHDSADSAAAPRRASLPPIEERLEKGDEVIVQIGKEPIGTKGARVTSNISLPGRYLVFLPASRQIGVSRRIVDENERQRLRDAIESVGSGTGGVIIRTACEGVAKREIRTDLRMLRKLWRQISRKAETLSAPSVLHQDLDVVLRSIRDLSGTPVSRVIVDDRRDYDRIGDFVASAMPRWRLRIELYEQIEPIFERFGVETQIVKALERKVWLKSGGCIVIDQTEALTAIDVNTGRFVGKSDQRDTALRTNLEAAAAIADQLRLRNIGGLIVIDFIDMDHDADRQSVLSALTEALRTHKSRASISPFSELGLVEMTRQRRRESLIQRLCEPCPTCAGKGNVKATATTAYEVLRRIRREARLNASLQQVVVTLHPAAAGFLAQYEPAAIRELQHELQIEVILNQNTNMTPADYTVSAVAAVPGAV